MNDCCVRQGRWSAPIRIRAAQSMSSLPTRKCSRITLTRHRHRQCMSARIGEKTELIEKVDAWEQARNGATATIEWPFTTDDARIKLQRLYPKL